MNRQEINNLEKQLRKYHNSIPDFPISNKQLAFDRVLTLVMTFLTGCAVVLIAWLIFEINKASII